MLGSNLGKKVDAQFMKNEYQTFLAQNHQQVQQKRQLTKEEKRAEARRKGIFVAADDLDFQPTVFEKPASGFRPAVFKDDTRPLLWKKDQTYARKKKTKTAENKPSPVSEAEKSMKETASKTIKVVKIRKKKTTTTNSKPSRSSPTEKHPSHHQTKSEARHLKQPTAAKQHKKSGQKDKTKKKPKGSPTTPVPVPEVHKDLQPSTPPEVSAPAGTVPSDVQVPCETTTAAEAHTPEVATVGDDVTQAESGSIRAAVMEMGKSKEEIVDMGKSKEEIVDVGKSREDTEIPKGAQDVKKEDQPPSICPTAKNLLVDDLTQQICTSPRSKSPPESQTTFREPLHPTIEKKDDVFGKMEDYEDKNFEVNTSQLAAVDKKMVDMARRLLKTAQRDKAFETVLTPQENELLAKFFSGKHPYDGKVLKILDNALDKTIDFLNTSNIKLDAEMKEMVQKRGNLKAAMMEAMLSTPNLLPSTWGKKYSEFLEEANKETNGINWFRILLCYPQQKSFGDGPEDQFGNFTRKKRHWLIGCIIGPSDSKSFLETKKEELSQGMFMDTSLIAKTKEAPTIHAEALPKREASNISISK